MPPGLRIALVSAEFAGAIHSGGIGTYMRNLADMLVARGHDVEVFAAGHEIASEEECGRLRVNTVQCAIRGDFPRLIAPLFMERHRWKAFDVAEGAEFLAETSYVAMVAPNLPLVLKLHTPGILISIIDNSFLPLEAKARFLLGGLRRGRVPKPYWRYDPSADYERLNLKTASEITTPSRAMVEAVGSYWQLSHDDTVQIPNVFVPPQTLLDIPPRTHLNRVTYVGRLEFRKGVVALARAIPRVLDAFPDTHFRLIGRSLPHPAYKIGMREYMISQLKGCESRVEFVDGLPYEAVLRSYAETDVCVFPSIWENFPNVCLEAMAAARGVVGSSAGGMAEIIDHGRTGILAPPRNPRAIAEAIISLLRDPTRRAEMGAAARAHVLAAYSPDVIAPLQEASYARAIARAQARKQKVYYPQAAQ